MRLFPALRRNFASRHPIRPARSAALALVAALALPLAASFLGACASSPGADAGGDIARGEDAAEAEASVGEAERSDSSRPLRGDDRHTDP